VVGDIYYHQGEQALEDPLAQSERAFGRALELDPSVGPTHIHLIENAFVMGDSALVRQRLEAFRGIAGESATMKANDLSFAIAFGDESTREAAFTVLDTVSFRDRNALATVSADLGHPAMLARKAEAIEHLLQAGLTEDTEVNLTFNLALTAMFRGRWGDHEEAMSDPRVSGARPFMSYMAWQAGLPVPEAVVREELTLTEADSTDDGEFGRLLMAAEQGRVADVVARLQGWRVYADSLEASGDSAGGRQTRWLEQMLEARAQWSAGDPEGALARLEPLQREATGSGFMAAVNGMQRFWLADLNLELGNTERAELYYRSLIDQARAVLALARIRDEAGDTDEAAQLYARFIEFWKDADPELQAQVEAARDRLQEIVQARG